MSVIALAGVNPVTQLAIEILRRERANEVIQLHDDDAAKRGGSYYGYTVVGDVEAIERRFRAGELGAAFLCFGDRHLSLKKRLFDEWVRLGIPIPLLRHPSALVSELARVGDGSILSFGAIVGHGAEIGCDTILWGGAVVEHDSRVGPHCYIGPNATLSGFTQVGECTLIGSGAVILPEIRIGARCRIGAGAVVTRDVPDGVTVAGIPARVIP